MPQPKLTLSSPNSKGSPPQCSIFISDSHSLPHAAGVPHLSPLIAAPISHLVSSLVPPWLLAAPHPVAWPHNTEKPELSRRALGTSGQEGWSFSSNTSSLHAQTCLPHSRPSAGQQIQVLPLGSRPGGAKRQAQEGWIRVTGAGADSEEKPHEQGRAQGQGVGKLCDEIVV